MGETRPRSLQGMNPATETGRKPGLGAVSMFGSISRVRSRYRHRYLGFVGGGLGTPVVS